MTKYEIAKNNKIIDTFMGVEVKIVTDSVLPYRVYEKINGDITYPDYYKSETEAHYKSNYQDDWNKLMPVLISIQNLGCIVELWMSGGYGIRIYYINGNEEGKEFVQESNSLIESANLATIDFINWYNLNK
jgi:hypothetical protein